MHELDRLKREVQTKLRIIQDLNRKRVGPSRVLDDLSAATPDNLWLIDFGENNGQATFTGLALDNETIARFMRQLQDSPYFYGVDLVETSRTTPQPAGTQGGRSAGVVHPLHRQERHRLLRPRRQAARAAARRRSRRRGDRKQEPKA